MTAEEWNKKFADASGELAWLAADGMRVGDDVTEREGELLDLLDELEYVAAVKCKQGAW